MAQEANLHISYYQRLGAVTSCNNKSDHRTLMQFMVAVISLVFPQNLKRDNSMGIWSRRDQLNKEKVRKTESEIQWKLLKRARRYPLTFLLCLSKKAEEQRKLSGR